MSNNNGFGSEIWKQAQRVRVTNGKVELPVSATKNGIFVGDAATKKNRPAAKPIVAADDQGEPRRGFLSRLFRRG